MEEAEHSGFTLIEVTLVLALTGMLLIGLLGGTFQAISTQRYNDSVRSYAEFLRTIYSEVISPESLGEGNSKDFAVYGKVLVYGYNYTSGSKADDDSRSIYTATLIGDATVPSILTSDFTSELGAVNAELFCGQPINNVEQATTVSRYEPLWQAELMQVNDSTHVPPLSINNRFEGTVIIARSPSSGVVHTIYTSKTYDLRDGCKDASSTYASLALQEDLVEFSRNPETAAVQFSSEPIGVCVKSDNASQYREVRIAEDGRNTSAISILNTDIQDDGTEGNRCR